jgi:hypothetical protein
MPDCFAHYKKSHNTKTPKSMEHSDMEALGFQLRNYYEEVE